MRSSDSGAAAAGIVRRVAWISGDRCVAVSAASFRHGDHAVDFVGELAEVAGPRIEQQVFEGFVGEGQPSFLLLVGEAPDVVFDERRYFLRGGRAAEAGAAGRR